MYFSTLEPGTGYLERTIIAQATPVRIGTFAGSMKVLKDGAEFHFPRPGLQADKKRELVFSGWFFILMYQFALVDALPVLWQVLPVSTGFHHSIVLCPTNKTFHKSSRFVYYLHHMLFLCHAFYLDPLWG